MATREETTAIATGTMGWCGCGESQAGVADRADRAGGRRGARWPWAALAAEAAGTALLVFLSCAATCGDGLRPAPALLQRALAAGLIVALIVQCFDHVSGAQLNPTVTLAKALAGVLRPAAAAAEAAAQLAGAVLGAALARLFAARPLTDGYCVTRPAPDLPLYKALWCEALLGACLALASCASWDARNRYLRDSWPLRIGLVVVALTLTAGDLTGASMNPARSFGPALWSGDWSYHWVYWAGPLSGSALATALYRVAWRAPRDAAARGHPEPSTSPSPSASSGPTLVGTSKQCCA